jgi:hypothetical protein
MLNHVFADPKLPMNWRYRQVVQVASATIMTG